MSDDDETLDETQTFVKRLEESGFFDHMTQLDGNLKSIAGDLQTLGQSTAQRGQEIESLAAHLLAIEAIVCVLLRAHPVEAGDVAEVIAERTAKNDEAGGGNPTVLAIAETILKTVH